MPSSLGGEGMGSEICRKISLEGTNIVTLVVVALWRLNFFEGVKDLGAKLKLHTVLEISKINIY